MTVRDAAHPPITGVHPVDEALTLALITRLNSIDGRLSKLERIADLVEAALKAVALESKNAAAIEELTHRVALLEGATPAKKRGKM